MVDIYDLIIVGAGPAGLTAGIYASRRKLNNLVLTRDIGGQAASVPHIENYPGFDQVDGFSLTDNMKKQAEKFGSQFVYEEVDEIINKNGFWEVGTTADKKYRAKALILSFGVTPRNLNVPGEKEFTNKGVTYCANCDAPLYKDKIVAVVGGGNSALDAAEYLSKIAKQVHLIHRRNEFRGDEVIVDKIKNIKNIEIHYNRIVTEILGDKFVSKIKLTDSQQQKSNEDLAVDGVFIEIGHIVNKDPVKDIVKLDKENQIIIDDYCRTSQTGIFAAGDVAAGEYKQIIIAAGEGAKAALSAYQYLQHKKGKTAPAIDWAH